MYDNRNWLWQYQDKYAIRTLYDGMFGIASNISVLPVLDVLNVDALEGGVLQFAAQMYNLRQVGTIVTDAVVWDVTDWNDPDKFWNGAASTQNDDFFKQYIHMKLYLFSKPFCIATIKDGLDILLAGDYTCHIVEDEENFHFDINITVSDATAAATLYSALVIDPLIFGKPSGYSYQINVTQG